jgi:vacuolar-type H+-ATPase subunit I/STV1
MAIKKASTVLISLPCTQVEKVLNSLSQAKFAFEILDPVELGGQWQEVKKLTVKSDSTLETKLQNLAKAIEFYTPKSKLDFLLDRRFAISEADLIAIQDELDEVYETATDLLEFRRLVEIHTTLFTIQKENSEHAIWIGSEASKVAQQFVEEAKKTILEYNQNHPDQLLEFTIPELTVLNYQGLAAISVIPERAQEVSDFLVKAEPDYGWQMIPIDEFIKDMERKTDMLLIKLKKNGLNPYKVDKKTLKKISLTHAFWERKLKQQNFRANFFTVTENSSATFAFVALEEQNQVKLREVLPDPQINISTTEWNKEIVLWEQNSILQPFQGVVQSLGTIGTKEADPSLAVGIFFATFFAMALNDALYGLVIALVCGFLMFKPLKSGFRNIVSLFFLAGMTTIVVGALTNSWAGDLLAKTPLNDFLTTFQMVNPLEPNAPVPLNQFLRENGGLSPIVGLLFISVLIGLAHIFTAYLIKIRTAIKQNDWVEVLGQVSWIGFLISIAANLITSAGTPARLGSLATLSLSLLGIFVFNHGHSLIGKILGGAVRIYELVSFFADTLSYTRLVAVGLTGSIIAQVINLLASMVYESMPPVIGLVAATLVLFVGHLFNLVVGLFGAYINPLRLHYVEFMPKFFQGSGRCLNSVNQGLSYVDLVS